MVRFCQSLLLLLGALFAAQTQAQSQEEESFKKVKLKGADYVTLESFCEVYGFDPSTISLQGPFELKGKLAVLEFEPGLRRMRFNGRRLWLSVGLIEDDKGRLLLAALDLAKTLEPLLRPSRIDELKPVKGVVIDPGHGGKDDGAYGRGMYEKNVTLDTSQRLARILKEKQIPVVMTRSSDLFLELAERADFANTHKDCIFVSLHYNTGPRGTHGVETFAMTPQFAKSTGDEGRRVYGVQDKWPGNANDSKNILLAYLTHDEMAKMHSTEGDRGVKRARFKVLRNIEIPGVLVEAGFLTNVVDAGIISSQEYREKVARAVAQAIEQYMNLMDPARVQAAPPVPVIPVPAVTPPVESPASAPVPASGPTDPAVPEPGRDDEVEETPVAPESPMPGDPDPAAQPPDPAPSSPQADGR